MTDGKKRPRIGSVICGAEQPDGTKCSGVCICSSTRPSFTWFKCSVCGESKKVARPK